MAVGTTPALLSHLGKLKTLPSEIEKETLQCFTHQWVTLPAIVMELSPYFVTTAAAVALSATIR